MDALPIFTKIAQSTVCALLLMGCAHTGQPKEAHQVKTNSPQTPDTALWHDGSRGGAYGIGIGWSIELLAADYETVLDQFTVGSPTGGIELISIPAEYEWIKDDNEDLSGEPIMTSQLVTIPAEYMTVKETIVVKPENTDYYLTDATYNTDGSIKTPKIVKPRHRPAETRQEERRVVKVPKRTVERMLPLERRKGFRRVVKTPASTMEDTSLFFGPYYMPKVVEAQPWRFLIKHPTGGIVHVFDDFDNLTAFVEGLK